MSIIQDALKKAEQNILGKVPEKEAFKETAAVSEKRSFNTAPILIVIFIALTVVVGAQFLFQKKSRPKDSYKTDLEETASHQEISYKPIPFKSPAQEPPGPEKEITPAIARLEKPYTPEPQFVLNGIMYIKDAPQAIINGSIVMVGDTISGAKVAKINKNDVVLNLNDVAITLTLKK